MGLFFTNLPGQQKLEKLTEFTLGLLSPYAFLGPLGMSGISSAEISTLSEASQTIYGALKLECINARDLALQKGLAPSSLVGLTQVIREFPETLVVALGCDKEIAKRAFSIITKDSELLKTEGSVAKAFEKVAKVEKDKLLSAVEKNPGLVEKEVLNAGAMEKVAEQQEKTFTEASLVGSSLSKNDIQHIGRHIPDTFAQQTKHMPKEALDAILKKRTFFNPAWSEQDILQAVDEGYKTLRNKGLTGKKQYNFKGEVIEIYIRDDGKLDSAWGLHRLSTDYFIR